MSESQVTAIDMFIGSLSAMSLNDRKLTLQRLMGLVHAIDRGDRIPQDLATQALDGVLYAKTSKYKVEEA